MAVLNYTTKIPAATTAAAVQDMLAKHGATQVMLDYADAQPVGITFAIATEFGPRTFRMPVDIDRMRQLLVQQDRAGKLANAKMPKAERTSAQHAARVGWRIVKDWLEAQLAILETRMVSIDQVMLPYLLVDGQKSLYAAYRESGLRELTSGGEDR